MITKTKHTPGPWKIDGNQVKWIDHGKWHCVASVNNKLLTQGGNEANARLIAASPELLEACKKSYLWLSEQLDYEIDQARKDDGEHPYELEKDCQLLRDAISKAEGEI